MKICWLRSWGFPKKREAAKTLDGTDSILFPRQAEAPGSQLCRPELMLSSKTSRGRDKALCHSLLRGFTLSWKQLSSSLSACPVCSRPVSHLRGQLIYTGHTATVGLAFLRAGAPSVARPILSPIQRHLLGVMNPQFFHNKEVRAYIKKPKISRVYFSCN